MKLAILVLALVSFVAVAIGTCMAATDLKGRIELLRNFKLEVTSNLPMIYNVHPEVMRLLADREPSVVAAQFRAGMNEVIAAIAEDRQARAVTDQRLADLAGVGDNLTWLKGGSALLLGGALVGCFAGILAAATA
jgi:hypothetical protein